MNPAANFLQRIKSIGATADMDDYEKRRLGIFNQINFFGLLTGIATPIAGLCGSGYLPPIAWVVACSPLVISLVVLFANYYRRYTFSMMWYFLMYPTVTALVYAGSIDVGIQLFFILYGVLAIFFLQNLRYIIPAILYTMACYFVVFVFYKDYTYRLEVINFPFYMANHIVSAAFIFLGLFMIKKENTSYQKLILSKNEELERQNAEIQKQRADIAIKAVQLENQTAQLQELNAVKNRLFSIISHDLKTPIYGLRNLFANVQRYNLPGDELVLLVPDIINDINYTTGLMENLLQWAKSQMQGNTINPQLLDIAVMVKEVQQLLRLQAENKRVYVNAKISMPIYIYADKDMINLVLRNLLSNAIKFTPQNGEVSVDASITDDEVKVFVRDTGTGISSENLKSLFGSTYFTTKGTANESGTGLGLMLCKEFITKNGGDIAVESELGKGSTFYFTLPRA